MVGVTHVSHVEFVFVQKVVEFAHQTLVLFLFFLLLVYLYQDTNTLASTHPEISVELSSVVEDRESWQLPCIVLGMLILVLFLTFLLYSQKLFVVDTPANRLIFETVAPVLEDISRKLGIGVAV